MNSEIRIPYEDDLPVSVMPANITNCPLHCHPDALEIIYVLQGTVDIKVSFENFVLKAGDFVIVNNEDFHFIKGEGSGNVVLSLFLDVPSIEKSVKHFRHIEFACESFLIEDSRKGHADAIRRQIRIIAANLAVKPEGYEAAVIAGTERIVSLMMEHFTILQYYSIEQRPSGQKLEKYYRIMEKMEKDYQNKALLKEITESEFYSKYYLSHLYKGLMMMSIQDSLSAMRCFKAEAFLLTTDRSIQQVSTDCGFSDTKYFYKHFYKWFHYTPAQYRKKYQPEVKREKVAREIPAEELLKLLAAYPEAKDAAEAGSGQKGLGVLLEAEKMGASVGEAWLGGDDFTVVMNLEARTAEDLRNMLAVINKSCPGIRIKGLRVSEPEKN